MTYQTPLTFKTLICVAKTTTLQQFRRDKMKETPCRASDEIRTRGSFKIIGQIDIKHMTGTDQPFSLAGVFYHHTEELDFT